LLEQLHDHEKKILLALKDVKKADVETLSEKTGLVKDAIEKASSWAKTKGIVDVKEYVTESLQLTEEGIEYAREGLPEKNLMKLITKGEQNLSNLKKKFKKLNIALVWARKNDWVKIFRGNLLPTEKGKAVLEEKIEEENVLEKLKDGRRENIENLSVSDRTVKNLLKRKLVKKTEETYREIYLTDLGKKLIHYLEKEQIEVKNVYSVVREKFKEEKPVARPLTRFVVGETITQLTPNIIKSGEWRKFRLQKYDITLPAPKTYPGKRHYMQQVIDYIRRVWIEMGFKEMTGPILEISFWNFDSLYQPQDHPARDLADTFYLKIPEKGILPERDIVDAVRATHEHGWDLGSTGWQYEWDEDFARRCVLRTHTTSLSARTLAKLRNDVSDGNLPAKYFSVGRVFRNETLDWKHLAEFYQTDGIVVGEDVTFRHLLGYLKRYFSKLGFKKVRFRPSYFPYTEMSTEAEVWHPEHKEWMELVGAGIFRPEVVKPLLGKDIPVLAWGPSLDRIVMDKYKIKDIRELYWNDLKQLREAKLWLG